MVGAWTKSAHNIWVKRLRRTSTLVQLLQVLWLYLSHTRTHKCLNECSQLIFLSSYMYSRFFLILLVPSIKDGSTKVTQLLVLIMTWVILLQALHLCPKHRLHLHCGWLSWIF